MDKQIRPVIIAMKGHPGTGKSTLAYAIATSLHCPLLDKDDVRDATVKVQKLPTCTFESQLLNDLSYLVLWRVLETQLRLCLPAIVIDSPLSRRAHLDCLLDLADRYGGRVVVIECKPGDEVEWKRRLEMRGTTVFNTEGNNGWHKPKTWEELKRLLVGYNGCTEYEMNGVPRLIVDTTAMPIIGVEEIVNFISEFRD